MIPSLWLMVFVIATILHSAPAPSGRVVTSIAAKTDDAGLPPWARISILVFYLVGNRCHRLGDPIFKIDSSTPQNSVYD